jgi:hypothetical protein
MSRRTPILPDTHNDYPGVVHKGRNLSRVDFMRLRSLGGNQALDLEDTNDGGAKVVANIESRQECRFNS